MNPVSSWPLKWGALVVSVIAMIAFIAMVFAMCFIKVPTENTNIVQTMVAVLGSGGFTAAMSYWVGSSSGSASKDHTIGALASNVPTTPASPAPTSPHPAA